ncbi:MAG: DUF2277 domain-containing protein [Gammaproteobacteria bacterium]|nr:DUF2277 domain-containing protein [Gammaproteobacteria bacterium]
MCRNIKTLYNFDPPTTEEEIQAASVQFVRKISGFTKPSNVNKQPFDDAVEEIELIVEKLIDSLVTSAHPRNREAEAAKAKSRAVARFG